MDVSGRTCMHRRIGVLIGLCAVVLIVLALTSESEAAQSDVTGSRWNDVSKTVAGRPSQRPRSYDNRRRSRQFPRRQPLPRAPQGRPPSSYGLAPVIVAWDPQLRRYVLLRNLDPRLLGMGRQPGGYSPAGGAAMGLLPVLSPSPFQARPVMPGGGRLGQGQFRPGRVQGQFQPGRGQGQFQPGRGQGQFQPERGQGRFQPERGQGRFQPEIGQGRFQPERGQGRFQPERGQGRFQPGRGHGRFQPGRGQGQSQGNIFGGLFNNNGIGSSRPLYRPSRTQSQRPTNGEGMFNYRRPRYPLVNDPPIIVCPDDLEVKAKEGKVTAPVTWTEPQAEDQEDGELRPRLMTSLGPGSEFPVGTHVVQYEVVDSKGATARCSFSIKVTVTLCPAIPRIPSLQHDCMVSGIIHGKVCNFRCSPGYTLVGEKTLKCTEKGIFDNEVPRCKRRKCPMLKLPPGGVYFHCSDNNQYGSLCFVQCDGQKGFSAPYGNDATRCGPNGDWLGTATCRDDDPPSFVNCHHNGVTQYADVGASFANVTWEIPEASDNSGDVNITQVRGKPPGSEFRLGEHYVSYVAEDAAGNRAGCAFRVLVLLRSCSLPAWAGDSHMRVECDNDLMHGSTCNVRCTMGRELEGSSQASCQLDGSGQTMYWKMNDSEPRCRDPQADAAPPCEDPLPPQHAYFSCARTPHERVCRMGCQQGFDFPRTLGPSDLVNTCDTRRGQWTKPSLPPCLPLRRPEQLALPVEARFRGRCQNSQDASRLQLQFDDFLSHSRYREACPYAGACGHQSLRCSCLNDRQQQPPLGAIHPYPMGLPVMQLHFVPVLFSWDFVTDFTIGPSQPPQQAFHQHSNVLHGLAEEIEKEMEAAFAGEALLEDSKGPGLDVQLGLDGLPGGEQGLQDQIAFESFGFEDVMIVCPEGMEPSRDRVTCMSCPPGMFIHEEGGCQSCPIGTYQDGEAEPSCKPCPLGTTTETTGTSREEDCQPQRDNMYIPEIPTRRPTTAPSDVSPAGSDVNQPDTPGGSETDPDSSDIPGGDDSYYYVDSGSYRVDGADYSDLDPASEAVKPTEDVNEQPSPEDPRKTEGDAGLPAPNGDEGESRSDPDAPSDVAMTSPNAEPVRVTAPDVASKTDTPAAVSMATPNPNPAAPSPADPAEPREDESQVDEAKPTDEDTPDDAKEPTDEDTPDDEEKPVDENTPDDDENPANMNTLDDAEKPANEKTPDDAEKSANEKTPDEAQGSANENTPDNAEKPANEKTPDDAEKPANEKTPDDEEKPANENTPDDTEKTANENTPDDAEKPANEKTPDDTEKPANENTPDNTEKPANENTPDDEEKPADENTPDDAEEPANEKTTDDTEKPANEKTPDDTEKPANEKTPDDAEKPANENTPDDAEKPANENMPDDAEKSANEKKPDDEEKPTNENTPDEAEKPDDEVEPTNAEQPDSTKPDLETKPDQEKTPSDETNPPDENTPDNNELMTDSDENPEDKTEPEEEKADDRPTPDDENKADADEKPDDNPKPAADEKPEDEKTPTDTTTAGPEENSGEDSKEERGILNPWANVRPISFVNGGIPVRPRGQNRRRRSNLTARVRRAVPPELLAFFLGRRGHK